MSLVDQIVLSGKVIVDNEYEIKGFISYNCFSPVDKLDTYQNFSLCRKFKVSNLTKNTFVYLCMINE